MQMIYTKFLYLKGEIVFENFLEIVGIKEVKVGALDELLED